MAIWRIPVILSRTGPLNNKRRITHFSTELTGIIADPATIIRPALCPVRNEECHSSNPTLNGFFLPLPTLKRTFNLSYPPNSPRNEWKDRERGGGEKKENRPPELIWEATQIMQSYGAAGVMDSTSINNRLGPKVSIRGSWVGGFIPWCISDDGIIW